MEKQEIFSLKCKLSYREAKLMFDAIDFYATASILFCGNSKFSKRCNKLWLLLNQNCISTDM